MKTQLADTASVPRTVLEDCDLSWSAKGCFCALSVYDRPVTIEDVQRFCLNGESAVRSLLTELVEAGYVKVHTETRIMGDRWKSKLNHYSIAERWRA
jgi:hypothetical protein